MFPSIFTHDKNKVITEQELISKLLKERKELLADFNELREKHNGLVKAVISLKSELKTLKAKQLQDREMINILEDKID